MATFEDLYNSKLASSSVPSFDEEYTNRLNTESNPIAPNFDTEYQKRFEQKQSENNSNVFRLWAGKTALAASDALGNANDQLKNAGVSTEAFWKPARKLAENNNKLGPLNVARAAIVGGADLFDSLANAPAGMLQQSIGIAPENRWRSDMAGFMEHGPVVQQARALAPETFDAYKLAGGITAPLPVGGVARGLGMILPAAKGWVEGMKAGQFLPKVYDMAATGALTGGTIAVGNQVKKNQEIDPLNALAGAGLGAVLGGGIGAVSHGVPQIAKAINSKFARNRPSTNIAPESSVSTVQDLSQINAEHLTDADDLQALSMLQKRLPGPVTQPPVSQPSASPVVQQKAGTPPLQRQRFHFGASGRFAEVHYPSELESAMVSHVSRLKRMAMGKNPKPYPELEMMRSFIAKGLGLPDDADVYPIALKYADQIKALAKNAATETGGMVTAPSSRPKQAVRMSLSKAQEGIAPPTNNLNFAPAANKPRQKLSLEATQTSLVGERRLSLQRDADGNQILGRARVGEATDPAMYSDYVIPQGLRDLNSRYAQAKVTADIYKKQLEQIANDLYKIFGSKKLGKYRLEDVPGKQELNKAGDDFIAAEKAKLNSQLPSYEEPLRGGGVRATLHEGSISQIDKVQIDPKITEAEAASLLEKYKSLADQSEKVRASLRREYVGKDGDEILNAQRRLRAETGDDFASLKSTVEVPGPDGKLYRVLVEAQEPRREMPLLWKQFEKANKEGMSSETFFNSYAEQMGFSETANALAARAKSNYDQLQAAINAALADSEKSYLAINRVSIKKASMAAIPIGLGLAANQPASAADGKNTDGSGSNLVIPATVVAAAVLAGKKFGPRLVRQFMKSPQAMIANLYKDSLDHVEFLDRLLGKTGSDALYRQILESNVRATAANWGVKWESQAQKVHAMALLRDKTVKPTEAIEGKAGTVFDTMSQQQRDAVVSYYLNQKSLLSKVVQYKQELETAIESGAIPATHPSLLEAKGALEFIEQSLSPRAIPHNGIQDFIRGALSSSMDFYFNWNPAHHLTNLTDSFISGGSRVGPLRIVKAWHALGSDKDIQRIFSDSNLVGSFKGEQVEQAALAKQSEVRTRFVDRDFPSDRVNANRVALASFMQYAEENAEKIAKTGFRGDSKQFVKELFNGKLDPSVAMDAWVSMSETVSRTLGVEPYRLNMDIVSRAQHAPAIGIFVKQPARTARLIASYLSSAARDKDIRPLGKLATMLGYMALFGGSGAISVEGKQIWENAHPDSYFAVSAALDKYNPYSMISGETASKKLEWSLFYPIFAAINPGLEASKRGVNDVSKLWGSITFLSTLPSMNWQQLMQDPKYAGKRHEIVKAFRNMMSTLGQTVMPRLMKGIPTGAVVRTMDAADKALTGEYPISYYHQGSPFPYAQSKDVPMDRHGIPRWEPFADMVLPGSPNFVYQNQMAKWEQKVRKSQGQTVPMNQQGYQDPLLQLSK